MAVSTSTTGGGRGEFGLTGDLSERRLARLLEVIQAREPLDRVEAPGPISIDAHHCACGWVGNTVEAMP